MAETGVCSKCLSLSHMGYMSIMKTFLQFHSFPACSRPNPARYAPLEVGVQQDWRKEQLVLPPEN